MSNKISLKLDGERITATKFKSGIGAFYSLLDEVSNEVSGKNKPIEWIVSVKEGSINLISVAEPRTIEPHLVKNIVATISEGLDSLENLSQRPKYFTDQALEYVERLADLPSKKNGLDKLSIYVDAKEHEITPHAIANINEILEIKSRVIGSVEGRLETITVHNKAKVAIYDFLRNKAITCFIPEDMLETAKSALGNRVYVFGLISYGKEGIPRNIKVEEIRIFPDNNELPTANDVCGILGD